MLMSWVRLVLVIAVSLATARASVPNSFVIVCFGDSTTAPRKNVIVYAQLLQARLKDWPGIAVLNRGVGGDTTDHARRRFESDVLAAKPDLVVIQFGMNDSMIDVWKRPPATLPRISLVDYERNLRQFVDAIHAQGGEAILLTPNQRRWSPVLRERYAKLPYDVAEERGLLLLMPDYVAAVRRVASERKVRLVDVYALYEEWEKSHGRSCGALMLDGCHPNTEGQMLVANALESEVRRIAGERSKRAANAR